MAGRSAGLGALTLTVLLQGLAGAEAHPHVWVTVECVVELDAEARVTGLRQRWTFDAMYSSYALYGLDRNGDGRYSVEELAPLVGSMTSSIRNETYFTGATIDGANVALAAPSAQALEVDPAGGLVMSFAQGLTGKLPLKGRALRIEVHDVEYYVDFQFSKSRFAALTPPVAGCRAKLDDGQPASGSDPEAVMNALIRGPIQTLASAVVVSCD